MTLTRRKPVSNKRFAQNDSINHKMSQIRKTRIPNLPFVISLNVILLVVLALALVIDVFKILPVPQIVLILLSIIGLLPVLISAFRALKTGELTIDLLASIALIFSFWHSSGIQLCL